MNFDDRVVIKSEKEKELDMAMERYEEHFGNPYVFSIGFPVSFEETIAEIETCIKENKPQKLPEYNHDFKY